MRLIDAEELMKEIKAKNPLYRTDVEKLIKEAPEIDPYKQVYDVLMYRYEDEAAKAFEKPCGLKEHAVWSKAIRIMEEYIR